MVGIVIVTHGDISKAFFDTVQMFIADLRSISYIGLYPSTNLDEYSAEISKAYNEMNEGEGVLFLSDLFGGTPTNKVMELMLNDKDIQCITGVNLGMMLEILTLRSSETLDSLAAIAENAGRDSIKILER